MPHQFVKVTSDKSNKTNLTNTGKSSEHRHYFDPTQEEKLPPLNSDQIRAALFALDDIFDWCTIPYVLLGQPARTLFEFKEDFDTDKLKVAVKKLEWTEDKLWLFRNFAPQDTVYGEDKVTFTIGLMPVEVKLITKRIPVFVNPDVRFHRATEFMIPNPFEVYWNNYKFLR